MELKLTETANGGCTCIAELDGVKTRCFFRTSDPAKVKAAIMSGQYTVSPCTYEPDLNNDVEEVRNYSRVINVNVDETKVKATRIEREIAAM